MTRAASYSLSTDHVSLVCVHIFSLSLLIYCPSHWTLRLSITQHMSTLHSHHDPSPHYQPPSSPQYLTIEIEATSTTMTRIPISKAFNSFSKLQERNSTQKRERER